MRGATAAGVCTATGGCFRVMTTWTPRAGCSRLVLLLVALVVVTVSSAVHGAVGFGMDELGLSLVLLPGVLLGYLGSNVLRPFVDGGHPHGGPGSVCAGGARRNRRGASGDRVLEWTATRDEPRRSVDRRCGYEPVTRWEVPT